MRAWACRAATRGDGRGNPDGAGREGRARTASGGDPGRCPGTRSRARRNRRGDLQGFTANGQLSSLGGAFDTFDFDAWEWRAGCGEPSGRVSVRTSDAVWLDVTFGGEGAARCDGCGEVSWRGQVLGEACDDFDGFRQAVMP